MKKIVSSLLVLTLMLCAALSLPARAAQTAADTTIRVRLRSDVAGLTGKDYEGFLEILSDNADFDVYTREDPVYVADYAGTSVQEPLAAGRTYYVNYCLYPINGYTLPEQFSDGDVAAECGKGVTLIHSAVTYIPPRDGQPADRAVVLYARVTVDGNLFQRLFGMLYDLYLKMRAWSLY